MHDKYYSDSKSTCSLVDLFLFINRTKCCSDYHHRPCGTCLPTSTTTTERSPSLATAATTAAATTTATAATTTQTATGSKNSSNYLIALNDTSWFNFFSQFFFTATTIGRATPTTEGILNSVPLSTKGAKSLP